MKQIWHPWTEWECYKAGMFDGEITVSSDEAKEMYATFLRDIPRFERAMERVVREWPKSCEHFLTNQSVNRIAWLGQSSMCIETGIPCHYRAGFNMMSNEDRDRANAAAARVLRRWEREHARRNQEVSENMDRQGLFGWGTGRGAASVDADAIGPIIQGDSDSDTQE